MFYDSSHSFLKLISFIAFFVFFLQRNEKAELKREDTAQHPDRVERAHAEKNGLKLCLII